MKKVWTKPSFKDLSIKLTEYDDYDLACYTPPPPCSGESGYTGYKWIGGKLCYYKDGVKQWCFR